MSSVAGDSFSSIETPRLSDDDEEAVTADSAPSTGPDSGGLCVLCRHLDFEYIGYHDSADYSSNSYFVQRDYVSVSSNSTSCVLCAKIVCLVDSWLRKAPAEQTKHIDTSRSRVDVRLDTDWHTVSGDKGGSERKAHSDRLRVNCAIPWVNASDGKNQNYSLTFYFQRLNQTASRLANGHDRLDSKVLTGTASHEKRAYTGRKRPLVADFRLLQSWKQMCQLLHGGKCSHIFKGTPKISPRVIDVHQRCLVQAKTTDTWVCLSYVWGTAKTTTLSKSNVPAYSVPGSLSAHVLPAIIEDALQVTLGLNERYLWVDSLCIVQDDPVDKAHFISQMDSIYALATVVIIAATCVDANSQLSGIRPLSRTYEPEEFMIRNVPLLQSLDPVAGVEVDLRTGGAGAYLGTTIWDTRAWTLQERFLASRSLVFTAEQIFWECDEAFWCEDSFREIPGIAPDPHRTSLFGNEPNLSWNPDNVTFDHFYRVLLGEYSTRKLKYDSDGLNAFSGVIRAFERSMNLDFFWGMPSAFLESALAWGNRTHGLRRRNGGQDPRLYPLNSSYFPSWSWVGWVGDGSAKIDNQNMTMEPLGLIFYRVAEDGHSMLQLKQIGQFNEQVDLLAEGSTISDRSSRTNEVGVKDLPTNPTIGLSSLLSFWTASAHVQLIYKVSKDARPMAAGANQTMDWAITISQDSHEAEVSWFQIPPLRPGEKTKHVEIIALAQNRGDWDGGHIANGAIGVMVVSWDAGVAFREGFAWIAIRDWIALADRTWKLVVLG